MNDFDIQINMNGIENEINSNIYESNFEGESGISSDGTNIPEQNKKSWIDSLNTFTEEFKKATNYKTNEEAQAQRQKELAEKGIKYKVLGMNPFVAVGVSLLVIVSGSIILTKIKAG